jgi:peptide chain release factor 2
MISLDVSDRIAAIRSSFADIVSVVNIPALESTIAELSEQAGATDLWDDQAAAQKVTSELSHAQSQRARVIEVQQRLDDLDVLLDMAKEAGDDDSARETLAELDGLEKLIGEMEVQTLLDGEYDALPAIITIRAGAGGVDAADFADMLLRMYVRWAEKHKYPATVLDVSYAEEAGIKSATLQVDSPFAFGTLSVEAGTHRLVRMSPFNSAGKDKPRSPRSKLSPCSPPSRSSTSQNPIFESTYFGRLAPVVSLSTPPTPPSELRTSPRELLSRAKTRRARFKTVRQPCEYSRVAFCFSSAKRKRRRKRSSPG